MGKQQDVRNYYKDICNREGIKPLPIKFTNVGKGGACVEYNVKTKKPLSIKFDLKRCMDLEYALLHEVTHQILLLTKKDPAQRHNKRFRKLENSIVDKYMYSDLSMKYRL